jgi:hypothetical protein
MYPPNKHTNRWGGHRRRSLCGASESRTRATCGPGAWLVSGPVLCRLPPPPSSPSPSLRPLPCSFSHPATVLSQHRKHLWLSSVSASGPRLYVLCPPHSAHAASDARVVPVRQADVAVHDRGRLDILPRRQGPGRECPVYVSRLFLPFSLRLGPSSCSPCLLVRLLSFSSSCFSPPNSPSPFTNASLKPPSSPRTHATRTRLRSRSRTPRTTRASSPCTRIHLNRPHRSCTVTFSCRAGILEGGALGFRRDECAGILIRSVTREPLRVSRKDLVCREPPTSSWLQITPLAAASSPQGGRQPTVPHRDPLSPSFRSQI